MAKPNPQVVTVIDSYTVTPNMQRICFQGDSLANFPSDALGGYIKLLFSASGSTDLSELPEGERPSMRTYTVRAHDPVAKTIEVDFVRHITEDKACGFAARWAINAQLGEQVSIVGPGSISALNQDADWFFLVADMTALPALSVKLSLLPKDAKGYAVIQVVDDADAQELSAPEGIEVRYTTQDLAEQVMLQTWLPGRASVWCACEFDTMRTLRRYFRNEKQVGREHIYISSYWKNGVTEDGHKIIKREDAEASA